MARVPTIRKADLDRTMKALADAGFTVVEVRVLPGGEVKIIPALTGSTPKAELTPLEEARARRAKRAAQTA